MYVNFYVERVELFFANFISYVGESLSAETFSRELI